MAVMQNMREYTKIILIIVVIAFIGTIIFDWGMDITGLKTRRGTVGEVNGTEITYLRFNEAYARELESYRNRTGSEPSENQLDFIKDQVWESLIRDILIQETFKKKGIAASDEEIIYRIFNAPPEILKNNPNFQNEQKQFDMALYQAALNDPRSVGEWKPVEDYLRVTLPYEELQQRIQATIRITEDEVKREYLKQNQKTKVKYIFISPARFLKINIEIADEMIEKYYKEHSDEFKEEEKRKIQYVLFPLKATSKDSAAQWELAKNLIQRVTEGEDFGELAEIYSEDPGSKDKGGDLGFFGKGAMVKSFEEAAFGAKVGETVGPIQSEFGLHVIKVEEKKTEKGEEKIRARHILLKFEASPNTTEKAREEAYYFVEEALERPFEEIAAEIGLRVDTTKFFQKGSGLIPGFGLNKSASKFIFSNKVGKIGEVEETPQAFFVYKISEIQKQRIKPMDNVKSTIKSKLLSDKRMAMAGDLTQEIYDKTQNGISFEDAAAQDSVGIKETELFTRNGYVSGVGRDAKFVGNAFGLSKPNEVAKPVEGIRGHYILKLMEKDSFNSTDYESKKEIIAQQILQKKQNQVFANWYTNLKAKANIKDYRDEMF